jgi:hypothetical protein
MQYSTGMKLEYAYNLSSWCMTCVEKLIFSSYKNVTLRTSKLITVIMKTNKKKFHPKPHQPNQNLAKHSTFILCGFPDYISLGFMTKIMYVSAIFHMHTTYPTERK